MITLDEETILSAMIDEMNQATNNTEKTIDDALAFCEESNKQIAK